METYRILLVATNSTDLSESRQALIEAGQTVVAEATSHDELAQFYKENQPEAVLLDADLLPMPDDLRTLLHPSALIILRSAETDSAVLKLIKESAGFATLIKPFSAEDAAAEIALAVSRNQDLMQCNNELDKVQTRLADRIVIEKAKGLLIQHENLTEPEAFKRIHFTARRANRTMRNVADEVIARYSDGTGGA